MMILWEGDWMCLKGRNCISGLHKEELLRKYSRMKKWSSNTDERATGIIDRVGVLFCVITKSSNPRSTDFFIIDCCHYFRRSHVLLPVYFACPSVHNHRLYFCTNLLLKHNHCSKWIHNTNKIRNRRMVWEFRKRTRVKVIVIPSLRAFPRHESERRKAEDSIRRISLPLFKNTLVAGYFLLRLQNCVQWRGNFSSFILCFYFLFSLTPEGVIS